jgi:hypothetical protein
MAGIVERQQRDHLRSEGAGVRSPTRAAPGSAEPTGSVAGPTQAQSERYHGTLILDHSGSRYSPSRTRGIKGHCDGGNSVRNPDRDT